jgi:hypothetical protein
MQPLTIPGPPPAAVFIHLPCKTAELWDEATQGPINEQGCDACESAPDGQWYRVWIEVEASR